MPTPNEQYDVIVIGGGPAGMMAAARAGEAGARVLLIEKNPTLGKKLLITGGGRCNITNATFDPRELAAKYGDKGKFLLSPFSQFNAQHTFDFFAARGLPLITQADNRAFPNTERAQSVFDVMSKYVADSHVAILTATAVTGFTHEAGSITGVTTKNRTYTAKRYILATGGQSRPETGSTGDALAWLTAIGHTVTAPSTALVPIKIKEAWVKELQGASLADVRLTAYSNGTPELNSTGRILFTHFGISGPLTLNMSKDIQDITDYGIATLGLDIFPALNPKALDLKLQDAWKLEQNKKFKNSLSAFVTPKIAPIIVRLSGIDSDKFVNKVSREERLALGTLMKNLIMTVDGFLGTDKAIVTSGGVNLDEVDFKTMQSRKYPNLYFAGDILDFDRPSGGFSLQICWTTGYIAGGAILE